ncbi:hypothetical protein GQ457_13G013100 [Hibiscus cannabinus]
MKVIAQEMSPTPCASKLPAKTSLAASEGWNPSQNTYDVALEHVPRALALQSKEVSTVPVPQQALLDSKKPAGSNNNIKFTGKVY